CHFANLYFLKHIPSRQKRGEGRDSCFEMQYHRANPVRGKKLAQVIAKLLPLQLLRGVGLEQRQHVHLARKSLVEAVNAYQIPDLYGSHVPCLQATMHGLPVATRPKIKWFNYSLRHLPVTILITGKPRCN
ncbi:hypothetical protein, partial [Escherichia coli]|uniref:hypothetical protein n=1 Tax=Escherichia coli TaxID=562 RepID=UPI001BDD60E1